MKIIFPRMETLQFHNAYDGGSKFIHYLSEELVRKGVEVEIVTTKIKGMHQKHTEVNGVKYTFLSPRYTGKKRILNLPYKFVFSYNLKDYLKGEEFDILHSTEMFSYFYLHTNNRKPSIFQCWALEPWYGKEPLGQKGIRKLYVKWFLRGSWEYCLNHSDSIAADAKFQIPRLQKIGAQLEKVWFIPNGVTFKKIQELKKKYEDIRLKQGIQKKDLIILSVCQIAPDKGIEDIINGFALVKKEIKDAKLIMVGRGILEEQMRSLIQKNKLEKEVIHLKNLSETSLFDYFFSSDIFVSAVLSEDFMISIEEGMASGLPIVSSAQSFLVKDGLNGYVVGFHNPKGIAEGILKIYRGKKMKEMGLLSKKFAREYDYPILAELAIKEYKKLLEEKKF